MTGWGFTDRPAMTVHGHGLLSRGPTGQKTAIVEGLERGTYLPRPPFTIETARKSGDQRDDYVSLSDRYDVDAINFSIQEGGVLQSYPPDFEFKGSRSKQYLQVGNAVPPGVAAAVLAHLWGGE